MALTTAQIQQAYVTFFSRPADPVGLAYWQGYNGSLADLYATFAQQTEYSAAFSGLSSAQKVNVVYQNLFGRDAEAAGLLYWAGKIESGAVTVANLALAVSAGSQGTDAVTVESRVSAATSFTAALDTSAEVLGYSGATANAAAKTWLAGVTTAANLATAVAAIDTAVSGVVAVGGAAGSTFTLTTGVDTFTGTSNNDVFVADNTGTDVSSSSDSINGGNGTDTLNIFSDGGAGAMPALTSVETLNVYDQDDSLNVSATNLSSLTAVNLIRGDGAMTLTVGANVANVGITDIATVAGGVVVSAASTATGITLNLNGVTASDGNNVTTEDVDVNGTALTSVTVNTTGTASTADTLDVASATSIAINANAALTVTALETGATSAALTITGASAVGLGTLDSAINTVTATSATGALTAAIGTAVDTVMTLGSGNDVITASTTDAIVSADTLSVDAGAGAGDVLVITETADVNTAADAARYKNFEKIRTADSVDMSLVSGITGLQLSGGSGKSYTVMSSTQAANVDIRGDVTSATFALQTATGTADALTLNMGTGTTTAAATSLVTGVTVTGFETLNIKENGGATATAGANRTSTIDAFTGATLNDINLSGRAVTLANIATTVAVDIDGSALTGNGATTGAQGLTVAGSAVAGSVVHGSAVRDQFTIGTLGSTYDGAAGNDTFITVAANLAADGTDDTVIAGGTGTDTITFTEDGVTLTDNHFTNVTGLEKITFDASGSGDISITTGAGFNTAFADGVTVTTTTSNLVDTAQFTFSGGLYSHNATLDITSAGLGNATGEDIVITTGSGNDTITVTAASWVGADSGSSIVVNAGTGNDTITVDVGTLVGADSASGASTFVVDINPGKGADATTLAAHTNGTAADGVVRVLVGSGESTTAARDTITGFNLGTANVYSDLLDFTSGAITDFVASADSGVIKSHSIASGIVTFDDADTYATALVINASNLADVLSYLAANTDTNDVAVFAYDSNNDGTTDGTMVFNNTTVDNVVEIVGAVALSASAVNAATAGLLTIG